MLTKLEHYYMALEALPLHALGVTLIIALNRLYAMTNYFNSN